MKYVINNLIAIVFIIYWLYIIIKYVICKTKPTIRNWENMSRSELKDPTWELEPRIVVGDVELKLCKFGMHDKKGQVINMSREEFRELIKFIERIK